MVLEMIYMFILSKCAVSEENETKSDTNTKGEGTAGDGTGGQGGAGGPGGDGGNSGLTGKGTEGDQLLAIKGMLETGSPEEIIARLANTGNTEYIHYIRNAKFETIGYERFNAAVNSLDSSAGLIYPTPDSRRNLEINESMDPEGELPEFPDLVRGKQKDNILTRNLKINPDGPLPGDEKKGYY